MKDAYIANESLLVIDRSLDVRSGNIVLALLNGEFTGKRYIKKQSGVFLHPDNDKIKPIRITHEMGFQVWGVMRFLPQIFIEIEKQ